MPKFFQAEIAAHNGKKQTFQNVEFKKNTIDSSDSAEAGTLLEIIPLHIKRPPVIQFMAYLSALTDKFDPQYSSEQPFGRSDPYYIYKSNTRAISVTFSVVSSSKASALNNLNNLSWFLASLYPTYKDTASATSIAASPLFRVRYSNIISSPTNDGQGLLCAIAGVTVTPDLKTGYIPIEPRGTASWITSNIEGQLIMNAGFINSVHEGKKLLIPKLIKITMSLKVVHDHALGWDYSSGAWRGGRSAPGFPYDFGLVRDTKDTPSAGNADVFQDVKSPPTPAEEPPPPGSIEDKQGEVETRTVTDDRPETPGTSSPTETSTPRKPGRVMTGDPFNN